MHWIASTNTENLKMSDILGGLTFQKAQTEKSPAAGGRFIMAYDAIVQREGGKTNIRDAIIIDMDSLTASLKQNPTPASMDIALIVADTSKKCKYLLADFKLNVTSPRSIEANVPNTSIWEKFNFSRNYIEQKDREIQCINIAFFIFKDKQFQQVRNAWKRRNLNNPKNAAVSLTEL